MNCKFCNKLLVRRQKLFCSQECYKRWQAVGKHACKLGRLNHTLGSKSLEQALGEIELSDSQLNFTRSERFTVGYNSYVCPQTHKDTAQLIKQFQALRRLGTNRRLRLCNQVSEQ